MAKMQYGEGRFSEETEAQIIESTMTRDEKMQELIKNISRVRIILPCGIV